MAKSFVPFDQFDQDNKFPHKSSRKVLDDFIAEFVGVMSVQGGIGIQVDDTDPSNPIVSATPCVLPQATEVVLGGLRLGIGLAFNPTTGCVDVTIESNTGNGGGNTTNYQAYLTEAITASTTIAGITAGETLPMGMLFTDFVKKLLLTNVLYPTFIAPSMTVTSSLNGNVESGTQSNITLTISFNRGEIRGALVSGAWNFSAVQNYRSGPAISYVLDGVNVGLNPSRTIGNVQIGDGVNTFVGVTNYSAGPQPKDSNNADYDTFLIAGSITANTTVTGKRRAFYGASFIANMSPPNSSADVRALESSLLDPVNGSTFTITAAMGDIRVSFAYPATLRAVTSVIYVEGLGVDIKGAFTETQIMVAGANGYSPIAYRVYTFLALEAFSASATYNITV